MSGNSLHLARALFEATHLPDLFDPDLLARHAKVSRDVILDALEAGELPGREFEPGEWRITKRAALAWIERREGANEDLGTDEGGCR